MPHEHILVIEDDEDIQELILHNLVREGLRVTAVSNGEAGLRKLQKDAVDCILLDLMLPGMDGIEVCRIIKNNPKTQTLPIIMVTAKGEESDIVLGLELGADDYIIKPFSPKVLIARLRSTLRRRSREAYNSAEIIRAQDIEIHPGRREVIVSKKKVELTNMEFQVLHLLASQPGWGLTRGQIIDNVRIDNYPVSDRSVDVVIVGLRKKLGDAGAMIETVRGVGYKFSQHY